MNREVVECNRCGESCYTDVNEGCPNNGKDCFCEYLCQKCYKVHVLQGECDKASAKAEKEINKILQS